MLSFGRSWFLNLWFHLESLSKSQIKFQNYHIWNFGHHTSNACHMSFFPCLHHIIYTLYMLRMPTTTAHELLLLYDKPMLTSCKFMKYTKSITKMMHVKVRQKTFVLVWLVVTIQCFWWWTSMWFQFFRYK